MKDADAMKDELWKYMKKKDPLTYTTLRRGLLGVAMNLRSKIGRKISVAGFKFSQKIYGFF